MQCVLEHVSTCHSIGQQLTADAPGHFKDPTPSLLALYEFEAKLVLSHTELRTLLEQVVHIPSVEAKTLETMAALCMRSGSTGMHIYSETSDKGYSELPTKDKLKILIYTQSIK